MELGMGHGSVTPCLRKGTGEPNKCLGPKFPSSRVFELSEVAFIKNRS